MDITFRVYAFDQTDKLHRIGRELYSELASGDKGIAELSNQTIRIAYVVIDVKAGQPVRLARVSGERWTLDRQGYLNSRTRKLLDENFRLRVNRAFGGDDVKSGKKDSDVIDLAEMFRERQINNTVSWEPTDREITLIVNDIWPETAGGDIDVARYLYSSERKRRPLTRSAKYIVSEISEPLGQISFLIDRASLPDLRSLEDNLSEKLTDPIDKGRNKIIAGIVDAVRYEAARQQAANRRTGVWYVVCQLLTRQENGAYRLDPLEHKRCKNQDEAVDEGRAMLKRHAESFSARHSIEIELVPEIEWSDERGR